MCVFKKNNVTFHDTIIITTQSFTDVRGGGLCSLMSAEIYFSLNLVVLNFFPKIPPSERIGFYENRAFKNKQ